MKNYLIFKHFLTELALNFWQLADMPRLFKVDDEELNSLKEEFTLFKFTMKTLCQIYKKLARFYFIFQF